MVLPPDEGQFEVRLWSGHLPRRTRLNALQCRRGGCVPSNEARTRSPKSCRAVRNLRRVATIVPARTPRRPRTRKGIGVGSSQATKIAVRPPRLPAPPLCADTIAFLVSAVDLGEAVVVAVPAVAGERRDGPAVNSKLQVSTRARRGTRRRDCTSPRRRPNRYTARPRTN